MSGRYPWREGLARPRLNPGTPPHCKLFGVIFAHSQSVFKFGFYITTNWISFGHIHCFSTRLRLDSGAFNQAIDCGRRLVAAGGWLSRVKLCKHFVCHSYRMLCFLYSFCAHLHTHTHAGDAHTGNFYRTHTGRTFIPLFLCFHWQFRVFLVFIF